VQTDEESRQYREFLGLSGRLSQSTIGVARVDGISVLSSTNIGSGRIVGSVLTNVNAGHVEAEGAVLVNVTAASVRVGKGAIVYNVVNHSEVREGGCWGRTRGGGRGAVGLGIGG
jgi:hypothetical protein